MRRAAILAMLAASCSAQHLHLGLKGGIPLNDLVESRTPFSNRSSRWTLGPMLEIDLPLSLGLEMNALYRRLGYSAAEQQTTSSWELPLLLKYRFPGVLVRPYVGGGWVFRHIGDIPRLAAGSNGVAFSGGLTFSIAGARLAPELRWTRWESATAGPASAKGSRNQVEVLVGLSF